MTEPELPSASTLARLLQVVSWEKAKRYRHGGRGFENVLMAEVFQALDYLPRDEFLGRILGTKVEGAAATVTHLRTEVEELTFTLLPDIVEYGSDDRRPYWVQPDGLMTSKTVFCLLEAKRIRRGSFQPEQLAREYVAVVKAAADLRKDPLLLLVLPKIPPVPVSGHGRLEIRDSITMYLEQVLEKAGPDLPSAKDLLTRFEAVVAFTTWPRIDEAVKDATASFGSDSSVDGSVRRLAGAVNDSIAWHGEAPKK